MDVAFRNPDGSTALVVHNENDAPRTFAVAQGGHSFEYTLPGGALATFTWPADPSLDDGYDLLAAEPMQRDGERPGRRRERRRRRRHHAVGERRGAGARPMARARPRRDGDVRRVVLDTGADRTDFPRGYELYASTDGSTWSLVATGAGDGQLTTIDIPPTAARHLRVVQTATAAQWWSVADVRVYR